MKKLLIVLILSLWTSLCFANDIYTGDSDDYTCYLQTESIKGTYKVKSGDPIAITTINYSVTLIPTNKKLDELKTLMIDNDITHMVANYRYEEYFNRVTKDNQNTSSKLFLVQTHLYNSSGNETYRSDKKDFKSLPEKDKFNPSTSYNEMFKYVNDHKEIVEVISL